MCFGLKYSCEFSSFVRTELKFYELRFQQQQQQHLIKRFAERRQAKIVQNRCEVGSHRSKCQFWMHSFLHTAVPVLTIRDHLQSALFTCKMASYSESGKSGKHLIHITHFFDPNHFWFKFTDPIQSNEAALSKLDAKIHEHAAQQRHEKTKSWRIGDIIAAYNITWNKWVRGKVENVIEMENGTPRYFLWALDYGTPLNVIGNYTRDLPQKLAQHRIFAVNEGCIYGIAPAEQVCPASLNYEISDSYPISS